jgi:hypothetical protein
MTVEIVVGLIRNENRFAWTGIGTEQLGDGLLPALEDRDKGIERKTHDNSPYSMT